MAKSTQIQREDYPSSWPWTVKVRKARVALNPGGILTTQWRQKEVRAKGWRTRPWESPQWLELQRLTETCAKGPRLIHSLAVGRSGSGQSGLSRARMGQRLRTGACGVQTGSKGLPQGCSACRTGPGLITSSGVAPAWKFWQLRHVRQTRKCRTPGKFNS